MKATRDRLKQAGLRLFSEQGYFATSIGSIETAAGLSPRSGGFYRHFDSKLDLAKAIAMEDIIETEEEFRFDDVLALEDTRSELLLFGRTYLRANERQKPYIKLIEEMRRLPEMQALEQSQNTVMQKQLETWTALKPAAGGLADTELTVLTLNVFGPLLFYTTKKLYDVSLPGLTDKAFLKTWASYWAEVLDKPNTR